MPLILTGQGPIHWAIAGAAIAAITLTLLLTANRRLGVSSGLEDVGSSCSTRRICGAAAVVNNRAWRMPLLAGRSSRLSRGARRRMVATWELGMFDA